MKIYKAIPQDLLKAQQLAYESIGLVYKNLEQEPESQDYDACVFEINNKIVNFRTAKVTPTKLGQFVTFWKRNNSGIIIPYDMADPLDLFVVSVRSGNNFGQFVFPKGVLCQKGFISKDKTGGKRAMRVYPPWDITKNDQAKKTQTWQLLYFCKIQPNLDMVSIGKLFS